MTWRLRPLPVKVVNVEAMDGVSDETDDAWLVNCMPGDVAVGTVAGVPEIVTNGLV